jgi:hypothetical protein
MRPLVVWSSLIIGGLLGCCVVVVDSFSPPTNTAVFVRTYSCRQYGATSSHEEEKLLERARLLREEAKILEEQLRKEPKRAAESSSPAYSPPKVVTRLEDSVWTLSYRFSGQPKSDDDDVIIPNYSGKLTLRLREDGYSELVSVTDDRLLIPKIWGWDEEYSQEDEQQYLLFSMDVRIPKSDPKVPDETLRYYFQAGIDREKNNNNAIVLRDGTVTVKKDVAEKTNGRWGLFNVAGILTEFRYVGDFVAKPSNE